MNKASGDDRILVEQFQILKDDAVKVLHSIYQQTWKTQQWPQDWKRSVFIPIPKKGNAKERSNFGKECKPHNCTHLTWQQSNVQNSLSLASTVCELWTSRCSKWIYKRQRNQRSNCQDLLDHLKSKGVPEKYLLLLYWLCQSLWLCLSQHSVENSSSNMNSRPTYLPPEKSVCRLPSNS